jgi:hypothetical protein
VNRIHPIVAMGVCLSLGSVLGVAQPALGQRAVPKSIEYRAPTHQELEDEFVALVQGFWDAVNRRDSVSVVAMLHPEALFVTTGVRKDREQLLADFAPWRPEANPLSDVGLALRDFRVVALSDEAVIVSYFLEWEQVHPRLPSRMLDSQVWVRGDEGWFLAFAHDSVADLMEFLRSMM